MILPVLFSYNHSKQKQKGDDGKQMYLRRGLFWWPCRHIEAMHVASPNAAQLGIH